MSPDTHGFAPFLFCYAIQEITALESQILRRKEHLSLWIFHLLLKAVNKLAFCVRIGVAKIIMSRLWCVFVLFFIYNLPGTLHVSFLTSCTYFLIKNCENPSLKPSSRPVCPEEQNFVSTYDSV